jgi:hypothetical protein
MIVQALQLVSVLALAGQTSQQMSSLAPAKGCPGGGEAVPCELRLFYDNRDGRVVPLKGDPLPISRSRDVEVWVETWTQYGKQWPQDELKYQFGTQRGCPGRYEISNLTPHRFRVRVLSDDADQCRLEMRLVSPRAVARELTAVWETPPPAVPAGAYSSADAGYVVRRLYKALLTREPDAAGFSAAVADLQAGRLELVVDRTLASPEYAQLHRGWNPYQLLQSLYAGFFDRPADEQGLRAYQPRIYNGETRMVVLEMLRSQEFRDRMAARR